MLAHPVRVRILEILNARDMSPVEFCRSGYSPADMELSHVAYHFRELAEYGCLAVVEENKRRGSVEHVYRGVGRAFFSDAQWAQVDPEEKVRISKTIFQGLLARVEGAMMAGTFDSLEDRHLSWIAMYLDDQGWREMVDRPRRRLRRTRTDPDRCRNAARGGRRARPSRAPARSSASPRPATRSGPS